MAAGALHLAVEELVQRPPVVDPGERVDDRQPVNLLVVLGLDVPTREEAVDALADANVVAERQDGRAEGIADLVPAMG